MENDIMEVTGHENSKLFVTNGEVFLNSSCVFFEYFDVLKAPWFSFLKSIRDTNLFVNLIDLEEIEDLDLDNLFGWYVNRKHRNFLLDLKFDKDVLYHTNIKNKYELVNWCNLVLENEMKTCGYFFSDDYFLNFKSILESLITNRLLVNKFICYSEYYSPYIEQDLKNINSSIIYLHGDLNKILEEQIPEESTFILSDIKKMNNLLETGKLEYSSIILTDYFKYNFDENGLLNLDKEKFENHIYKLDLFNNLTV